MKQWRKDQMHILESWTKSFPKYWAREQFPKVWTTKLLGLNNFMGLTKSETCRTFFCKKSGFFIRKRIIFCSGRGVSNCLILKAKTISSLPWRFATYLLSSGISETPLFWRDGTSQVIDILAGTWERQNQTNEHGLLLSTRILHCRVDVKSVACLRDLGSCRTGKGSSWGVCDSCCWWSG